MKLVYFQGPEPNFGDELNTIIWPSVLPKGFLDESEDELFLGIGSIIWDYLPKAPKKHIMGAGFGGYTPVPNVHDGSWNPVFVRGPRTAAILGLPGEKAICDGAIFLKDLPLPPRTKSKSIGFMPHFESLPRGNWEEVCKLANVELVDPRASVDDIISKILSLDILVTEAMHGAIAADVLRTPWIAVKPIDTTHHMKWFDWSEALSLNLRQHVLWPSTFQESVWYLTTNRMTNHRRDKFDAIASHKAFRPINWAMVHAAASSLAKAAKQEPQLSEDAVLDRVYTRANEALRQFVRTHH